MKSYFKDLDTQGWKKKIPLLILVGVIAVGTPWTLLTSFFLQNLLVLRMLLPFLFLFGFIYFKFRGKEFAKIENLLPWMSVVLTILFFTFSTFHSDEQTSRLLESLDVSNCSTALTMANEISGATDVLISYHFETEIYKQSLGFVKDKYGLEAFVELQKKIYELNRINGLIDILPLVGVSSLATTSTSTGQFFLYGNLKIKTHAEEYVRGHCAKFLPSDGTI